MSSTRVADVKKSAMFMIYLKEHFGIAQGDKDAGTKALLEAIHQAFPSPTLTDTKQTVAVDPDLVSRMAVYAGLLLGHDPKSQTPLFQSSCDRILSELLSSFVETLSQLVQANQHRAENGAIFIGDLLLPRWFFDEID
jgi:hypothetical protein